MAGLGQFAATPKGAQQAPAAGAASLKLDESDLEQPTPEEQAEFEAFEQQMLEVIYPAGEEARVAPHVLDNLKGNVDPQALAMFAEAEPPLTNSPVDLTAATAVLLTMLVEHTAGIKFSDDVVFHGGRSVIEELIEIAEAAKIHEFSEQEIEGVVVRAVDLYRISSPRIDPEALKAEFGRLIEADKAGKLGSVLPGLPGGDPLQKDAG